MAFTLSWRALTGAVLLSLVANGVLVGTAAAAEGPDIRSTVEVPQGTYLPGDRVTVKLTVANVGTRGAYYLRRAQVPVSGTAFSVEDIADWGDLGPAGLGASYLPGESREYTLRGVLGENRGDARFKLGTTYNPHDVNPADDQGLAVVPVVPASTEVTVIGQVFGDADQDGKPSPGEGLAGARMALRLENQGDARTAVTDAAGRYAFTGVPVGKHHLSTESLPGGWVNQGSWDLRLDGSKPVTEVPVRGQRPLAESLRVNGVLDKSSYTEGEQGEVAVTLTNTGTRPLNGIFIACDRGDHGRSLAIDNWGELTESGPGATLQPGQTREFRARGAVRPKSAAHGFVDQYCDFATDPELVFGEPQFRVFAKVTGQTGNTSGQLFHDANGNGRLDEGEALADKELRLTDVHNGHEFTARTDAEGRTALTGPAGRYRMTVPGWEFVQEDMHFELIAPSGSTGWQWALRPVSS